MSNNKYKILVIEDEANIRSFVGTVLEAGEYRMIAAENGSIGRTMFLSYNPDLIILDLGLPDMDGLELIGFFRKTSQVPVIVLSARSDEKDKVSALDLGANDYVTKPFGTAELMARVRAALRNRRRGDETGGRFILDSLTIDYDKRCVTVSGSEINLTQTEYNIIACLSQHAGKVMTYTAIIKAVWGYPDAGSVKKLQVNMANIRKKLYIQPGKSLYIVNELGVGYRMREQSEI